MIILYSTPSCNSCRKAKSWLRENSLSFVERNVLARPLETKELKKILELCENGTADIISTRSKVYQKLADDFDELSLDELLQLVEQYPSLLRRPLIIEGKKLQVGFNADEIRQFIPREIREIQTKEKLKQLFSYRSHRKLIEMD